jgi:hypothetical protein
LSSARRGGPLLVTGAIRTGTTWVGETLGRSPDLEYIWEPFNPLVRAWPHSAVPHFYTGPYDAQPLVDDIATALLALRSRGRLVGHPESTARELRRRRAFAAARRAGRTPLLKDPLAALLARHFQDRFAVRTVVTVRHPAGFVASCLRLGWDYDFENLLAQPLLMQRLAPWREAMEATVGRTGPMLDRVSLLWRVIYGALGDGELAPAAPYLFSYEQAVADPTTAFRDLFRHLDLAFPPEIETAAAHGADATRADAWREQLTADDVARVRLLTQPEAERWGYDAAKW